MKNTTKLKECDIVMKGGITSGIVYPKAIYQIAKRYRFLNIGGTSAGAIAAVLTAAAEYRRRNAGSMEGFYELNSLPQLLGNKESTTKRTKLFSLFKAAPSTVKIFDLALKIIEVKGFWKKLFAFLRFLPGSSPVLSGVLVLFTLGFSVLVLLYAGGFLSALPWILFSLLFFTVLFLATSIWKLIKSTNKKLTDNHFGLTNGYGEDSKGAEPLTGWLAKMIDDIAGKDKAGPLTFGDLEGVDPDNAINLRMVTSNLTLGKPYTLPFKLSDSDRKFFFRPSELLKYFPRRIVAWMYLKGAPVDPAGTKGGDYRFLPASEDMPIVVAARMSLSFPILISAIPLYAIDRSLKENRDKKTSKALKERCFFSDGGICSNFPVHFFDSPLPRRPTFAMNLRPFHPSRPRQTDETKNIYMPPTNNGGQSDDWNRFGNSIPSFLMAIIKTMQNWSDNTQMKIPGYRDRVVHIHLSDEEGGLNLDMDEKTIKTLSVRGKYAGVMIRERFLAVRKKMGWNNHRWIRFRIATHLFEENLKKMEEAIRKPSSPPYEDSYIQLMKRKPGTYPKSYRMGVKDTKTALEIIGELRKGIRYLMKTGNSTAKGRLPSPIPELKTKPKI